MKCLHCENKLGAWALKNDEEYCENCLNNEYFCQYCGKIMDEFYGDNDICLDCAQSRADMIYECMRERDWE